MVIEDEPDIATALEKGLRQVGYAVDMALDGERGSELALVNDYDLLILDLNLPGVDGLEVCQRVRAECPSLLILMLTARSRPDERVAGLRYRSRALPARAVVYPASSLPVLWGEKM